jgi:hypothetical protein
MMPNDRRRELVHAHGESSAPAGPARWLDLVVRAGYVAKGIVYTVIGAASALVAAGWSERARGSQGAMYAIAALPMGRVLIGALLVGLASYAALSFVAAVRAPEGSGTGLRGGVTRAADAFTGIVYAGLAAGAVRLLAEPEYRAAPMAELWAARVMALPAGAFALGAGGVVLAGAGLALLVKSRSAALGEQLDRRVLSRALRRWVIRLGRAGTAARGLIFILCGAFVVHAAVQRDPGEARDVGEALTTLGRRTYGPALLGVLAAGFVAYGVFQLAKARWRRLRVH